MRQSSSPEVFAIGLEQIAAVELFGPAVFVGIELRNEGCGLRAMGELVVAGDAGVALLQSSDRLVDLIGLDELFIGDASREFFDIGQQARFLFCADGAIFADSLVAV